MKKIFYVFLLFSSHIFAGQLYNFNEIKFAAIAGKPIHIVTHFSQCTSNGKAVQSTTNFGVFSPSALQVSDSRIATSLTHFTLNNPGFPEKPVYEFVKYTFTSDNTLNLSYLVLDAVNYTKLANKVSFNCALNTGVKIYSY